MAGTLHDQIDVQDRIDDVVVDNEVVPVLDERPIHMRRPIHQQERHREYGADPHHQADEERKPDKQMTVADQKGQKGISRRGGKHGIDVVERFRMAEESSGAEAGIEHPLVRCGIEKRPCHQHAKDKDETAFRCRLVHGRLLWSRNQASWV